MLRAPAENVSPRGGRAELVSARRGPLRGSTCQKLRPCPAGRRPEVQGSVGSSFHLESVPSAGRPGGRRDNSLPPAGPVCQEGCDCLTQGSAVSWCGLLGRFSGLMEYGTRASKSWLRPDGEEVYQMPPLVLA